MPKGGARVRSGPAAQRGSIRSAKLGWEMLPVSGREGDPPAWPLSRPKKRELELWAREWAKPQAIMWERLAIDLQVALYVRQLAELERGHMTGSEQTLLQRRMDDLGLTKAGQERNRWDIVDDAPAPPAPRRETTTSAKARLTALEGGRRAS